MPSDRVAIGNFLTLGSTDGSEGRAGSVGQILSVTQPTSPSTPVPIASDGVLRSLGVLNLPPGDWDVTAAVDAWLNTILTDWSSVWLGLGPGMLTIDDFNSTDVSLTRMFYNQIFPANVGDQVCSSVGPVMVNSAIPVVVNFAMVWYCSQNVPGLADYVIRARRMR